METTQGYVHQEGSIFWAILEAANHSEMSGKVSASAWSHREPWSIKLHLRVCPDSRQGNYGTMISFMGLVCAPPPRPNFWAHNLEFLNYKGLLLPFHFPNLGQGDHHWPGSFRGHLSTRYFSASFAIVFDDHALGGFRI